MSKKTINELTLSNGLKLIGEVNPANKSSALGFFVNTGARDETEREAGLSHFLEHMMFKGTPKRSAIQLTFDMGNIGAQANAYTSQENTVYYAGVVPEYFSDMQEILCDMLRPSLDNQEFDTEKNVILEEIALYMDLPHAYLFEKANKDYFGSHPLSNSVLGTTASISAVTRDEMAAYFERRYAPNNMTLVASGDFNWDKFVKTTEKLCGHWKPFEVKRAKPEFIQKPGQYSYTKANLQQAHLLMTSKGAGATTDERYALAVFANILGDGSGSRLYWDLIETGIADSASADHDEHDGVGTFTIYSTMETQKLAEVQTIIAKAIHAARDFDQAEFERSKTKILTRIVMNGELPMGRLMALGTTWLYRQEIHSLQQTIERIKALTAKDIHTALEKFPLKVWNEFVLLPQS